MLLSVGLLLCTSLILGFILNKIGLPELLGMIGAGILLGPYCLNFIDQSLLQISSDLRIAALLVILIRAGLGVNARLLKKTGVQAILMSFVPCVFEGLAIALASVVLLKFDIITGAILGFIIAAVSPAIVVPQMILLKEYGFGKKHEVPTLILAASSVDDVFAITLFTIFLNLKNGSGSSILVSLLRIPLSIFGGIIIGILLGIFLIWLFKYFHIRDSKKVLIFFVAGIFFHKLEDYILIASLIGVMSAAMLFLEKSPDQAKRLSSKFSKVWVAAEILLFTSIGMEVEIQKAFSSAYTIPIILIILIGLIIRSIGVFAALSNSIYIYRERLFCAIAFLPKATVQAAIGAIPFSMGLPHGDIILSASVMSILITAPLGAILIKATAPVLLNDDKSN